MKNVLVIGDGCKDVFQYGKCDRLCPEAPVPVFKPLRATNNNGMALNTYANLVALGVDCDIITTSGITKTRYVDETSNQMIVRVDENDNAERINNNVLETIDFSKYVAVVISDYNKGFLFAEDILYITKQHRFVFMDTKKKMDDWALGVKFIKINEREFKENTTQNFVKEFLNNLIVTKGKNGATLISLGDSEDILIEEVHMVRDLSGAGDTFLAGLVADYIKNNDIRSAIRFANKCASWVVTQKGVVVVDLTKI